MGVEGFIGDGKGTGKQADLHQRNGDVGLVVFNEELNLKDPQAQVFINETIGSQMALNAGFTGTPSGVHNGGDTVLWTATALAGTWDFASATNPDTGSACVDATATINGDIALFTSPAILNMSNFVALTGRIRLESWGGGTKHVRVSFQLGGTLVSNVIDIDDFIDTNLLNVYQTFSISKSVLGINTALIDEMIIETFKNTGTNPGYRLDNMQLEEGGGSVEFRVEPLDSTKFRANTIRFTLISALDTTLLNNSMTNLSYDTLLSVPELAIGIVIQRISNGVTQFSIPYKSIGGFLQNGLELTNSISDDTNTLVTVSFNFPEPAVLDSRTSDFIRIIINDDLTGLISLTALVVGSEQKIS